MPKRRQIYAADLFCGAGGTSYNDLDDEIVSLFRIVRDRGAALLRALELTPYSRTEFHLSFKLSRNPLEQARRTVVRSYMGFGGNLTRQNRDLTPQRTGFRTYSKKNRRSIPAGDWHTYPQHLSVIIKRLQGVIIEKRDASRVIREHDGDSTLHYVDPPYVHSTRGFDAGGTHRGYRHEMSDDQHRELAAVLRSAKGMVVLSGYPCDLYDDELFPDWKRFDRSHMADGARRRTEVVWLNDAAAVAMTQQRLPLAEGVGA
ncbi:MAG: DNA adenine methylase [Acidobacteriota bacterium]|nr:DNA adenine methylase [Acidobacteriota bacterium]